MKTIKLFLTRLVPVLLAFVLLSTTIGVTPVYAEHNGEHLCRILEAAVRSATIKGIYYYANFKEKGTYRISWTNGKSFCIFEGATELVLKTSFVITNKSKRAAVRYFVSDAIKHNAQRLPTSFAVYFLRSENFARLIAGASGSGLISFRFVNLLMQCAIYLPKDFPGCNTVVYDF